LHSCFQSQISRRCRYFVFWNTSLYHTTSQHVGRVVYATMHIAVFLYSVQAFELLRVEYVFKSEFFKGDEDLKSLKKSRLFVFPNCTRKHTMKKLCRSKLVMFIPCTKHIVYSLSLSWTAQQFNWSFHHTELKKAWQLNK
jgi:hypothetical protein